MKRLVVCMVGAMSLSAFAMTDQEVCEAYGVALATNSSKGQVKFISELKSRVESNTWTLNAEQCNKIAMESKHQFNFDLALDFSTD
ncbi:hypothetical protein [Photobacterium gaetbulicola]|nr:hypothetical protein [Photobacterium gaetbulicola]